MNETAAETPERARAILDFWFGELDADGMPAPEVMRRWFEADADFDAEVRERFGPDLERVDELGWWQDSPAGALALVVLTDQLSRNIHRGSAAAFARDSLARTVARRAIAAGHERALRPIERVVLYLPLEHAEDLDLQEESVRRFRALAEEVPESLRETFADFVRHAENHHEVIARFGRFPHRNAILGRADTEAEREYLEAGAARWGQGG